MAKDIDELYNELDHLPNQERKYKRSRKGKDTVKICMMISTVRICMMNIADGLENRDIAIRIRIQQDGDTVMQIRIQQDPVIRREENVKNAGMTGDR